MALITRVSRLFTADVHAVLDRIEEPEVILKQSIREMADALAQAEQRLQWLASEQTQLEQRASGLTETIASLDSELDLCFAAGEETLARSLVKRKLAAEQQHKQVTQHLAGTQQDHDSLEEMLVERRQELANMQQKADLLVAAPSNVQAVMQESVITQDAIDVAFLREKQRRQS